MAPNQSSTRASWFPSRARSWVKITSSGSPMACLVSVTACQSFDACSWCWQNHTKSVCRAHLNEPCPYFWLYPQKGCLAVGSDADLALWDPNYELTYGVQVAQHRTDYNLYEGWQLRAFPVRCSSVERELSRISSGLAKLAAGVI